MRAVPHTDSAASDTALLTKATIRAAERLNIKNKALARIIGLSEPSVSRMKNGAYALEKGQKPFELAVLFVRFYRSLDAVVGGDDGVARQWLKNHNTALGGPPIEHIKTIPGLINVIQYLDARRAII